MEGYHIVVKNLSKVVKSKKKEILHNVNFEVNPGEFVAIIGCSGAGKTTLMNLMSGYSSASSYKLKKEVYYEEEY